MINPPWRGSCSFSRTSSASPPSLSSAYTRLQFRPLGPELPELRAQVVVALLLLVVVLEGAQVHVPEGVHLGLGLRDRALERFQARKIALDFGLDRREVLLGLPEA